MVREYREIVFLLFAPIFLSLDYARDDKKDFRCHQG